MFTILKDYWPYFGQGILYTLGLSLLSLILGSFLGLLLSLMRLSKSKILNKISGIYISIFRGTPLFTQLLLVYFVPDLTFGLSIDPFTAGLIAVALNSAAYVSEIIRSGVQSVDVGQKEAGRSLGLSEKETMRYIILPQAIRNILPALGNELITLVKETSIVSTIGVTDIMYGADKVMASTYTVIPVIWGAIFYFIINLVLSKIVDSFEKKVAYDD